MVTSLQSPRRLVAMPHFRKSGSPIEVQRSVERSFRQTGRHHVLAAELDAIKADDAAEEERRSVMAECLHHATVHNQVQHYFAQRRRLQEQFNRAMTELYRDLSMDARHEVSYLLDDDY